MNFTNKFIFKIFLLIPISSIGQVDFTSSNLPILKVSTLEEIIDEPKIEGHLGLIWNGDNLRNNVGDSFNHYDGKIGIEIRGASSQWFPKKSYSFETRNEDGSNNNVSLLGMPSENDWVLHGPFSDKSLMRNAITYTLASWIMDYAPRVRFCELFVNDDYKGVYLLTEKIKRDNNRVNIDKMTLDETDGDELTGGYIIKIDKAEGGDNEGWISPYRPEDDSWQETVFFYHYPKPDEITPEQELYIESFITSFEESLKSEDYKNATTGYRKFVDIPEFLDFMFINEIGRNVDGYRLSTFMHKDKESAGGKLKMGPVWDFNLAFGNVDYCIGGGTKGWALDFNSVCPDDFWIIPFWWERLREDHSLAGEAAERWKMLRNAELSNARIFNMIDSLANLLEESADRNFERWDILTDYVWPNSYIGGSYENEIDFLKNWLTDRLTWLDENFERFGIYRYIPEERFDPIIYPNPFRENVTFKYYVRETEKVNFKIFNSLGALVFEIQDFEHFNGNNTFLLDTSDFPSGIYFYSFWIFDEKRHQGKIIKQ